MLGVKRAVAFVPTDIAGCKLWYNADSLVLNDTDPVSTWIDSSGNGNNATGSGTARPLYRTNIVNGKPVVRFDGSNDILTTSYVFASAYTLFVAYNRSTLCPVGGGGIGGTGILWRSTIVWSDVGQPSANLSSTPYTGAWSYAAFQYNGSRIVGMWLNAGNILSGLSGAGSPSTTAFQLGNGFDGYSSCDIRAAIVYDSVLGTTDRQTVETYLASQL